MPIEHSDVALAKASIIERCIKRVREEYASDPELENYTNVDAMTLNIERACQASIDLAMHMVAKEHLGVPQSNAEAFILLHQADLIDKELEESMRRMTGFRNIAIHQYREVETGVLKYIAEEGCLDLIKFCRALGLNIEIEDS